MARSADTLRNEFSIYTEGELADMLDLKLETIRAWRSEKQGPKWIKLGKGVYYRAADIADWIESPHSVQEPAT